VNEARDMCFSLLNVICSYTCKKKNRESKKQISLDIREIEHLSCLSAVSAKKSMQAHIESKE
jgi:hypothetical protein